MLTAHVSMSLDGYVAGPGVDMGHAMGRGGDALHAWLFADPKDPVDRDVAAAMFAPDTVGAVLMGRRTLDVGLDHWGDDGTFGVPCFVVSHRAHPPIARSSTMFTFVTDGLGTAVELARAAAGVRDVNVMGADLTRQLLVGGLIDELQISLVPIVLGGGASLFGRLPPNALRLEQLHVRPSVAVTHIRYRVQQH